jgi:hypothetical protein
MKRTKYKRLNNRGGQHLGRRSDKAVDIPQTIRPVEMCIFIVSSCCSLTSWVLCVFYLHTRLQMFHSHLIKALFSKFETHSG